MQRSFSCRCKNARSGFRDNKVVNGTQRDVAKSGDVSFFFYRKRSTRRQITFRSPPPHLKKKIKIPTPRGCYNLRFLACEGRNEPPLVHHGVEHLVLDHPSVVGERHAPRKQRRVCILSPPLRLRGWDQSGFEFQNFTRRRSQEFQPPDTYCYISSRDKKKGFESWRVFRET